MPYYLSSNECCLLWDLLIERGNAKELFLELLDCFDCVFFDKRDNLIRAVTQCDMSDEDRRVLKTVVCDALQKVIARLKVRRLSSYIREFCDHLDRALRVTPDERLVDTISAILHFVSAVADVIEPSMSANEEAVRQRIELTSVLFKLLAYYMNQYKSQFLKPLETQVLQFERKMLFQKLDKLLLNSFDESTVAILTSVSIVSHRLSVRNFSEACSLPLYEEQVLITKQINAAITLLTSDQSNLDVTDILRYRPKWVTSLDEVSELAILMHVVLILNVVLPQAESIDFEKVDGIHEYIDDILTRVLKTPESRIRKLIFDTIKLLILQFPNELQILIIKEQLVPQVAMNLRVAIVQILKDAISNWIVKGEPSKAFHLIARTLSQLMAVTLDKSDEQDEYSIKYMIQVINLLILVTVSSKQLEEPLLTSEQLSLISQRFLQPLQKNLTGRNSLEKICIERLEMLRLSF